jgi:hypothetical protein
MAGKQKHAYQKRVTNKNENMTDAPKQKKISKMMALFYIVLGLIILPMLLVSGSTKKLLTTRMINSLAL